MLFDGIVARWELSREREREGEREKERNGRYLRSRKRTVYHLTVNNMRERKKEREKERMSERESE